MIDGSNPNIDPTVLIELRRGVTRDVLADIGHRLPAGTAEDVAHMRPADTQRELGRLTRALSEEYAALDQEPTGLVLTPEQDAMFDRLLERMNVTQARIEMGLESPA